MLWQILFFPLRALVALECLVLVAIAAPFVAVARLFGLLEPADLPA